MSYFISIKVTLFELFEVTVTRISVMNRHPCGYGVNSGRQVRARQSSLIMLAAGDFLTIMIDVHDAIIIKSRNIRFGRTLRGWILDNC
jgi:hypothetical protein